MYIYIHNSGIFENLYYFARNNHIFKSKHILRKYAYFEIVRLTKRAVIVRALHLYIYICIHVYIYIYAHWYICI